MAPEEGIEPSLVVYGPVLPLHYNRDKSGAPRQNRTAITGLQNQCTAIVLVGLKENSLVTLLVKGEYGLCMAPQRGIEPRTSTLTVSRNYRCATEE